MQSSSSTNPNPSVPSHSYSSRVIYCYSLPNDPNYANSVKVGQTTVNVPINATREQGRQLSENAAHSRIIENIKTIYGQQIINEMPNYTLEWHIVTDMALTDHKIHDRLKSNGISRNSYSESIGQREWFNCNANFALEACESVINSLPTVPNREINAADIKMRPEQGHFVKNTLGAWNANEQERLWNAKPRFGKTFTALEFLAMAREQYIKSADEMRPIKRVLILTHKPAVNDSWSSDFTDIMIQRWKSQGWNYASRIKSHLSLEEVEKRFQENIQDNGLSTAPYIYFASMQDARGKDGEEFKATNNTLFDTYWDMVIIDEAHEGNLTQLAQEVHEQLKRTFTLFLSGTPFRHLANGTFEGKVDTWDYIDEQMAKEQWDSDEPNPYEGLPRMWLYTLDLAEKLNTSIGTEEETGSFSFNELFAIDKEEVKGRKGKVDVFRHEEDIRAFLDSLTDDESINLRDTEGQTIDMPYSNNGRRESRHALWVLPPRVEIARLLEKMLKVHPYFKDYAIVNVAGDAAGPDALAKLKNAIYGGDPKSGDPTTTKTITLTVGRLTTGVTVEPWTTCLMLNNMSSPEQYMQTIFRVQSPHYYDGKMKSECFVYDFAPDRALRLVAESLDIASKAGQHTETGKVEHLQQLTNYLPIMSSVDRSTLARVDAKYIQQAVKRIYRERVLEAGFDTPLLFQKDLQNLSEEQRAALEEVKLASGKSSPVTREKVAQEITISANGLDNYEYAETDAELSNEIKALEEKPRKERTPEEEEALAAKKAEDARRRNIRNILRTMSVRIPAMCIAMLAEDDKESNQRTQELKEDFTLEKFAGTFDEESWSEFFGTISKETFLTLAPCFDSEILQVAVAGWIKEIEDVLNARKEAERLKKSDGVEPFQEKMREFQDGVKHVMSRIKNPNKETVFTPYNVVELVYEAAGFTSNQKLIDEMRASYGLKEMIESQPIVNEDPLIVGCLFGKPWTGLRGALVPGPNDLGKPIEPGEYSTFYDINVKSGLFPLYAASQLAINSPSLGWEEICNNSIYANSRTLAGKWITAALLGMPKDWENITVIDVYEELNSEDLLDAFPKDEEARQEFLGHFLLAPLAAKQGLNLHISDITKESQRTAVIEIIKARRAEMKDKEQPELGSDVRDKLNQELDLRFDFVVSNPPYQIVQNEKTGNAIPIWQNFVRVASHIGRKLTFINPARWQKGGSGTGLGKIKKWLLNQGHLQSVYNMPDSDVFPTATIEGDIAIENIDMEKPNLEPKIGSWSRSSGFSSLRPLKVNKSIDIPLDERDYVLVEAIASIRFPSVEEHLFQGGKNNLTRKASSVYAGKGVQDNHGIHGARMSRDTDYFILAGERDPNKKYIEILYLDQQKNLSRRYLDKNELRDTANNKSRAPKYQVLMSKTHAQMIYRNFGPIAGPDTLCTPTWICRSFNSKIEAESYVSYATTYFYRYLLVLRRVSQNAYPNIHRFVPDLKDVKNPRTGKIGYQSDWIDDDLVEIFKDVLTPEDWCHIKRTAVAADKGRGDYEAGWQFPNGSTYKSLTKINCTAVSADEAPSAEEEAKLDSDAVDGGK